MNQPTELRAILFADIAGSTSLYESAGDRAAHLAVTACLDRLIEVAIAQTGRIVKTIGDEILCSFEDADHALMAASAMQIAVGEVGNLKIRIGFHFGAVVESKSDVFGDTVNLAARVVALCNPGQILTTKETYDALAPHLKAACRRLHSTFVDGRSEKVTLFELISTSDDGLTVIASNRPAQTKITQKLVLRLQGRQWEIDENSAPLEIGRGVSIGIRVNIPTASRNHATVGAKKGKFILKDASSNGTHVRMSSGDELVLHREELVLTGKGQIGLGCPVAKCSDFAIDFEVVQS